MPLNRATVTVAARITLPAYVILATYLGLVYLIDPGGRAQQSPALTLARMLLPMPAWGAMFLALAAVMAAALFRSERTWFVFALYLNAVASCVWCGVYLGAVIMTPDASLAAPAWPLFVAAACAASARSLIKGEV